MDVPATRPEPRATHAERPIATWNGFLMLAVGIGFLVLAVWQLVSMVGAGRPTIGVIALVVLWVVLGILALSGLYTLQPNTAAILQLFGDYRGTSRVPGLRFTNPFYSNKKLSLRARNLTGERLKVNDKRGNPIEIAAVVVWHVHDTARAVFEVDDYENFVQIQSESALRQMAQSYPYDSHDTGQPSLRSHGDEVNSHIRNEIQSRLGKAGVSVIEARISHLAYAQEIAQAMLQRQQAGAIIGARTRIVEGAVSMVEMALDQLARRGIVDLDPERKTTMVSNLLVVLCGERNAQPVINAGTLY